MERMRRLRGIVLVALIVAGCGHFRLVKDRYKDTKTVAIVQFVGEPAKDLTVPFDLKNLTGPSPFVKMATNDAIALQDFLKERGFNVVPIDEMVKSDKYNAKGDNVPSEFITPQGMKIFTSRDGVKRVEISFMTANAIAKELGVDAVVLVHSLYKTESAKMGLQDLARTVVTIKMVDKTSNQIWEDVDWSDSDKAIATMSIKSGNTEEFVASYNDTFKKTLKKMQGRIDEALK
jgi:hypothetical protein